MGKLNRLLPSTSRLFVLALWSLIGTGACSGPRLQLQDQGGSVHVTIDGEPFIDVHYDALPKPFLFPVIGPGGVPMTRSYPMAEVGGEAQDHPHHQSFWFAHGDVNGYDFWHGKEHAERIVASGPPRLAVGAGGCSLTTEYRWLAEENVLVCSETRVLSFHADEAVRMVDLEITLRPGNSALVLGDTKEGSLALRVHPSLRVTGELATGRLLNSAGDRDGKAWGKRARWLDDSGTVEGQDVGITIFDHPQNPNFPTWWHAREYGLIAANPFGAHDFEKLPPGTGAMSVPVGSQIRFRYRVLLHGADWTMGRIEAAWQAWSKLEQHDP